jgi:hypothetical protein
MTQKVAVAIVHGIGTQGPDFYRNMGDELKKRCRSVCGDDIVTEPVYWARVLQDTEDVLWQRMVGDERLDYGKIRRLMIDLVADAMAYQPTTHDRKAYDGIHAEFAKSLSHLAEDAGEKAPLCIIAHSLGTVIASNFIYDLQNPHNIPDTVKVKMKGTPLDRGETLTLFYTMGSPLALWSLRFRDFGQPVTVPSPQLTQHYPGLKGEWVNYYDRDDVIAFPLKVLNDAYQQAVTADTEVNVGGLLSSWNPLAHMGYWTDRDILDPISRAIITTWKAVNPQP